ncbi:MAG: hypothetical protein AAF004_02405 [Pseudomonadota bacterium]
MNHRSHLAIAILLLLTGGCHAQEPDYESARAIQSDGTIAALSAADVNVADIAVNALADELGLRVGDIVVDSVRPVTWPDASVGCPEPGQAYAQVLTPGHKITLRANGKLFVMHEANGHAVLCTRKKTASQVAPGMNFSWAPLAATARADLAAQLGIAEKDIIIARGQAQQWPDSRLGCDTGDTPAQATPTDGFVITLRYGSRNYTYHADDSTVIACPAFSAD